MISLIVAMADGNVIGGANSLLWHISEDLRYFKEVTMGHTVIMGRKTYESIGRPLPKRKNIVISRDSALKIEGCIVVNSLESAIELSSEDENPFIIGGGEIYKSAIDIVDRLYVTKVMHSYEGDTYFPEISVQKWSRISAEFHARGAKFQYPFMFETYEKI